MGAAKPSLLHLLPSSPKPKTCKSGSSLQKPSAIQPTTRRSILFSLPISTTLLLFPNPTPISSAPLPNFDPVSPSEKDASLALSRRISIAVGLLDKGREFQAQGDFSLALEYFTQLAEDSSTGKKSGSSLQKPSAIQPTTRRSILFSLPISTTLLLFPNPTPISSAPLPNFDPVSPSEKDASLALSRRISIAVGLLDKGREFQAQGDFSLALEYFTQVVNDYKEFAFSDYARVGRALALYEVGDREEAIAEMEDVSISLKGYPEVHAALAAALYTDKHAPLLAENQFTIATLLDPHYTDISYVREMKHWPPSLVCSLQHFITLS
ncbi:uncharacterized protein LOC131224211 [Magnolia sinica]|uniref:uncharacterized protein LOC131224211 n=1 Tax=Magnolia sinica TaxID=86752 RepID=UPI00265A5A81|nr:uncharacterized protein LOC131224211 [Magnolia sinica]